MNKLILGTVQFGVEYGINNSSGMLREEDVSGILNYAKENGLTILDTAAAYGLAEERIGNYHKYYEKFKVITKFSKDPHITWRQSLKKSIGKLNVEGVDTVMFHSFDDFIAKLDFLSDLIGAEESKLYKKLGVSVYTNSELLQVAEFKEVDVVQLPFNLLDNDFQRGKILKKLKQKGKEIHTRSAFLQGLFFTPKSSLSDKFQPLVAALDKLNTLAKDNSTDIGHLALQYALNKEYIDKVLIGVDSIEQLKQNLVWAEERLNPNLLKEIDAIIVENVDLLNPSKW